MRGHKAMHVTGLTSINGIDGRRTTCGGGGGSVGCDELVPSHVMSRRYKPFEYGL